MDKPIPEAVVFKAADALCGEWNLHYPVAVRMATVALTAAQQQGQAVARVGKRSDPDQGTYLVAEWLGPLPEPGDLLYTAQPMQQGGGEVVAYSEQFRASGDWSRYPIGTRAYAIQGGHWERVEDGWKWCTGSTFPTPGGDAFHVAVPVRVSAPPSAPVGVEAEPGAVRALVTAANAVLALYPHDDQLWTLESAVRPFNATRPAECSDGCPPQQVCDYCQIAALAQQPAAVPFVCTGDEIRCHDGNGCECAMQGKQPAAVDEARVVETIRKALHHSYGAGRTDYVNFTEALDSLATQHQEPTT